MSNNGITQPTAKIDPASVTVASNAVSQGGTLAAFGEYQLLEKLGEGGMGQVYKARQPMLDRFVAVKLLPDRLAANRDFISRFRREAVVAARLNHPNIVQVHAAGESHGAPYFVMEFVDGESLQRRLDREGRIPAREALSICLQLAQALDYAWRKEQVIHRDIKPANIFLTRDGTPKLGDMGLAKIVGGDTPDLTQTGCLVGTPHYISPEQAQSRKDVDFRTDIYSLGGTLFHLLTGQCPYKGNSSTAVLLQHVQAPLPDAQPFLNDCAPQIGALLKKMMAKDPAARHESYEELINDLKNLIAQLDGKTFTEHGKSNQRLLLGVLATVAVLLLLLTATFWIRSRDVTRPRTDILSMLPAGDALKLAYKGQAPPSVYGAPPPQLRLELFGRRKGAAAFASIKDGDVLASEVDDYIIVVQPMSAGYLYVFQVDTAGNIAWLFPRNPTTSFSCGANPVVPNQPLQIPPAEVGRAFFLDQNTGIEHVYVVFSAARWTELERSLARKTDVALASNTPQLPLRGVSVREPLMLATRGIGGMRPSAPSTAPLAVQRVEKGQALSLPVIAVPLVADGSVLVVERWFRHVALNSQ